MAHTSRASDERRRHPKLFEIGDKFGMHTPKGIVYGTVASQDEGGWIYPDYIDTFGQQLPGWFRSTQIFKVNNG